MEFTKETPQQPVSPIEWTEALSLDNEEIDAQHRQLFSITNRLISNADAASNSELINETLYELLRYVDDHFCKEEELLLQANYPDLNQHKILHRDFTRKIAHFCLDVARGKATVTRELTTYMSEWILQHTRIDDLDYKRYI